jgi:Protein of unknown function (DUF2723)
VTDRLTRSAWLAATIVFAAALMLYMRTLAPTITWAHSGTDGADLTTAAATLGVPHPPGYPTYITIGFLFSKLPIGNIAYRLNLMSAVFTALAAGLITLTLIRLMAPSPVQRGTLKWADARAGVGIIAGLIFAAAPMVWGQATIAEVHGLNAFFVALIVYLLAPIVFRSEKISARRIVSASLLWGFSCGNLLTIGALFPLMIVAWWKNSGQQLAVSDRPSTSKHLRSIVLPMAAFAIGLNVYWLVAVRAAAHPLVNWGNAITFDSFLNQITAQLYRGYMFAVPLADYPNRLIAVGQMIVTQFGWPGVLLGTIGVYQALNSRNKNWRWLISPIALYSVFAFTYNTLDADLYFIPVWLFAAWAIARGSLEIIRWINSKVTPLPVTSAEPRNLSFGFILQPSAFSLLLILLLVPANIVISNFTTMDLSQDDTASKFMQEVGTLLPRNAIVLTATDAHTFTLWYYRAIEHHRPDITVIDARLSEYQDWYDPMVIDQGNAPNFVPFDPAQTWPQRLAAANPDRPLCEISPYPTEPQVKCP